MTKRMSANAPTSPCRLEGTRVSAVVIAHRRCPRIGPLSNLWAYPARWRRGPTLRKPDNSVDWNALVRESRSPMPRRPNASKSIVFAFAARISLR